MRIYPVILAGGSGTRLWPLSREHYPKQFQRLVSDRYSLLQQTVQRFDGKDWPAPYIISNETQRFLIRAQLSEIGRQASGILLEPCGRGTAPAIALAALQISRQDPEAGLIILPSDHLIGDTAAFLKAVELARQAAGRQRIVTFGIDPTFPATGYGYIRRGEAAGDAGFAIAAFHEKPDQAKAETLIASGDWYWNSGMFVASCRAVLAELERLCPEIVAAMRTTLDNAHLDAEFIHLPEQDFAMVASQAFDIAVMERTDLGIVIPMGAQWNDLGAWPTLWDVSHKDGDGNVTVGDVIALETTNSYIRSNGPLTTVMGADGLIVVATDDAILITDRHHSDAMRQLIARLEQDNRVERSQHPTVYRPWGSYRSLAMGARFQVKLITVLPQQRISLQLHHQRAEHWIVVNGLAKVTRDKEEILLRENESIYIPVGTIHRLENPGETPLEIVEVQSGSYLGEDDIVRFDDAYGRLPRS